MESERRGTPATGAPRAGLEPVAAVRCPDYEPAAVLRALRAGLAPLGGMRAFVGPGQRVLVKPNLLRAAAPAAAITTHPAVVEAVVRLVQEAGGRPLIGDTPSGEVPATPGSLRRIYRSTGLLEVAERTGAELNWDVAGVTLASPTGRLARRLEVIRPAVEADVVLAVPKLKTHSLTSLTCAAKILFGLVPGLSKPGYHATFADPDQFGDFLLDLLAGLRPALFVVDGVVALEGDGPGTSGRPRPLGALLAGADATAVDLAACQLIGLDPRRVPTLRAARARGWWDGDSAGPTVLGEPLAGLAVPGFALPASATTDRRVTMTMVPAPAFARRLATRLLLPQPVPRAGRCSGCGSCVRACPTDAVALRELGRERPRGRLAVVDRGRCIHCYCCQEVCPDAAIDLELTRTGRIVQRLARFWPGG